jgi:AraC family transcriptional regulator of adaptative response/methylated-DNA-[protein]-cysteine methyltransferase
MKQKPDGARRAMQPQPAAGVTPVEKDPRWLAVRARDPSAEGRFVYAVKTTGVYCRPGSPSRLPDPRNVEFFESENAARAAGYRPSRRQAADARALHERNSRWVERACRRLAAESPPPGLRELAAECGLSAYHFHRMFKDMTGLTPRGFALAQRAGRVRQRILGSRSVTQAIYDSGFHSNARFYAQAGRMLGMTPTAYRSGGAATDIHFAVGQCSLGAVLVAQSRRGVCAISLGEDPDALVRDLQDRFPKANLIGADAGFERRVAQVIGLIESPGGAARIPLDLRGTVFQLRVWQALRDIPPGSTATYAQIAQRIGAPSAVRAVAGACAANPVAVAIPCHRVVRSDGSISGYRWGVERKRELLRRESKKAA